MFATSVIALITSLGGLFTVAPPSVPAVFFPSRNPAGCVSVMTYEPGRSVPNEYAPLAFEVVEMFTDAPRSSVPVSVTVAPLMPVSPAPACTPSLFASMKTVPASELGGSSPKLFAAPVCPLATTMLAMVLLSIALLTVPGVVTPPPAVSLPSRRPAGCVSVIV